MLLKLLKETGLYCLRILNVGSPSDSTLCNGCLLITLMESFPVDMVTFAELKVTTRSYLTEVYEFSVPAYQIDRLYEIFLRYKDHFMDTYFLPTVHLLKKLKLRGVPLQYNRKLVVLLSEPLQILSDGDFYLQAGVTTPATVSLKYQCNGKLYHTTVKEEDYGRLLSREWYQELCSKTNGKNVFLRMVLRDTDAYDYVSVDEIRGLREVTTTYAAPMIRSLSMDSSYRIGKTSNARESQRHRSSTDLRLNLPDIPQLCSQLRPRHVDVICPMLNQPNGKNWRYLADLLLDYGHSQVSAIAGKDNPCLEVLEEWMKEKGDAATTDGLFDVLQQMQRCDVIDALKKPLARQSSRDYEGVSSSANKQPVKQMSTDHEDRFPSIVNSTSDRDHLLPHKTSTNSSSHGGLGLPFTETRAQGPLTATSHGMTNMTIFGDPYPEVFAHLTEQVSTASTSATDPVQVHEVKDDGAAPPNKEVNDLAAAITAVDTAPVETKPNTSTEGPYPMLTKDQVRQATRTEAEEANHTCRNSATTTDVTDPVQVQAVEEDKAVPPNIEVNELAAITAAYTAGIEAKAHASMESAYPVLSEDQVQQATCTDGQLAIPTYRDSATAIDGTDPLQIQGVENDKATPLTKEANELAEIADAHTARVSPTKAEINKSASSEYPLLSSSQVQQVTSTNGHTADFANSPDGDT